MSNMYSEGSYYPDSIAYRGEPLYTPFRDKDMSVLDILLYEKDVLGNIDDTQRGLDIAEKMGWDLGQIPANRSLWITPKKEVAESYGPLSEVQIPPGTLILIDDGDDGYFVLFPPKYTPEHSHRTAIARKTPSKPLRILLEKGYISKNDRILDFGCGKGRDVEYLRENGYDAYGYDPYNPEYSDMKVLIPHHYTVVLNFYVLNVIPIRERYDVVDDLYYYTRPKGEIYIAVRDTSETIHGQPYEDGLISSRGTFQHLFTPEELTSFLKRIIPYWPQIELISRKPLLIRVVNLFNPKTL